MGRFKSSSISLWNSLLYRSLYRGLVTPCRTLYINLFGYQWRKIWPSGQNFLESTSFVENVSKVWVFMCLKSLLLVGIEPGIFESNTWKPMKGGVTMSRNLFRNYFIYQKCSKMKIIMILEQCPKMATKWMMSSCQIGPRLISPQFHPQFNPIPPSFDPNLLPLLYFLTLFRHPKTSSAFTDWR